MPVILPTWTPGTLLLYAFIACMALLVFPMEYYGLYEMQYSKFRAVAGMPTRLGMFVLYFTPLVGLVLAAWPYLRAPSTVQLFVFGAVALHFAKRVLESLFLHKYSGPMAIPTMLLITSLYTLTAVMTGWLNRQPLPAVDAGVGAGVILFVIGIVGNFSHHFILANLRKGSTDYVIPQGGLFGLVACPHYLFEIITWLGIALMSRHLAVWLFWLFMAGYLSARSLKTLRWYHEQFPDFPKARKALIPFVL